MMQSKAQISMEFLIVFSLVLVIFLFFFILIANQRSTSINQNLFLELQTIAQYIASQLSAAQFAGNGFTHNFTLPYSSFTAVPFNVSISKSGIVTVTGIEGTQIIHATSSSNVQNVVSSSSYLSGNNYQIPISTGMISLQNSEGNICVDYTCSTLPSHPASVALTTQNVHGAYFNGVSDYVDLGTKLAIPNALTVAVWINTADTKATQWVGGQGTSGVNGWSIAIENNLVEWRPGNGAAWGYAAKTYVLGTWAFVVGTWNGATSTIYVNGKQGSSNSLTGPLNYGGVTNLWLGQIQGSGGSAARTFDGYMANMQMYNSSLSQSQVLQLYNEGIGGAPLNTNSLVGWWPLNGNLKDYSGSGNNGNGVNSVLFPPITQIFAKVTDATGAAVANALVGFSTTAGLLASTVYTVKTSTSNVTNSNGIASAFLTQSGVNAKATVSATVFTGNHSTQPNLVAWWPMDLNQGSSVPDVTGNGYSSLVMNQVAWGSPRYVANFSGSSNSIITSTAVPAANKEGFGVNLWIYPVKYGAGLSWQYSAPIFYEGNSVSSFQIGYQSNGMIDIDGRNMNSCVSTDAAPLNTWTNVGVTQDASYIYIYMNGHLSKKCASFVYATLNPGVTLGYGNGDLSNYHFVGKIANVQVYSNPSNYALSATQMQQIYSEGISSPPYNSFNLIGWFPLNGDAKDYSGYGYNATVYPGVAFEPLKSTISNQGVVSTTPSNVSVAYFAGNAFVGNIPATSLPQGEGAMSIFAWIKTTNTVRQSVLAYGTTSAGTGVSIDTSQVSANGNLWFDFASDYVDSGVFVADGKWHLVGFTSIGNTANIIAYVDGLPDYLTVSTKPFIINTGALQIGRYMAASSVPFYFNGMISNVQIYNKSLNNSQIMQIYRSGITGAPVQNASIVGWWPLAGSIADHSSIPKLGSIATNVVYSNSQAYVPLLVDSLNGTGLLFNGDGSYVSFGNAAGLSPEAGASGTMSLCAWYKVLSSDSSYYGPLLKGMSAPSSGSGWEYTLDQSGTNEGYTVWNSLGSNIVSYYGVTPKTNQWKFACFTYDHGNSKAYYYKNGVQYPSGNAWSNFAGVTTANLVIGSGEGGYSNVGMSNLQLYNSYLTPTQITQLYDTGIPLVAYANVSLSWYP